MWYNYFDNDSISAIENSKTIKHYQIIVLITHKIGYALERMHTHKTFVLKMRDTIIMISLWYVIISNTSPYLLHCDVI